MPCSFVASWEYAVGTMSFIPLVGVRISTKTTNAIREIGVACDAVLETKVQVGNAGLFMVAAEAAAGLDDGIVPLGLVRPASVYGRQLLIAIGTVVDTAYATMVAQAGVPALPPQIYGYWNAAAGPLAYSPELGFAVARYVSAVMPPPTGSGMGEGP